MRAEYGPHIKAVVGVVPPDWVLDKGMDWGKYRGLCDERTVATFYCGEEWK